MGDNGKPDEWVSPWFSMRYSTKVIHRSSLRISKLEKRSHEFNGCLHLDGQPWQRSGPEQTNDYEVPSVRSLDGSGGLYETRGV